MLAIPRKGKMADARGQIPREALGMDLQLGHIHAHHYARSEAPPQCHRPAKRKSRSQASSISATERQMPPTLP